jgi:hypothetical protein
MALVRQALRKAAYLGLETGSEGKVSRERQGEARERSELERRFPRLCHKHGLPLPHVNVAGRLIAGDKRSRTTASVTRSYVSGASRSFDSRGGRSPKTQGQSSPCSFGI